MGGTSILAGIAALAALDLCHYLGRYLVHKPLVAFNLLFKKIYVGLVFLNLAVCSFIFKCQIENFGTLSIDLCGKVFYLLFKSLNMLGSFLNL